MKKVTLLGLAAVAAILASGATVQGAEVGNSPTKGSVNFMADEDGSGPVVLPGEETDKEIIIDEEPFTGTKGALRIEHVPSFNFGDQKVSSLYQEYDAIFETYKEKENMGSTSTNISHFTQVTDERGTAGAWKLSVKAGKFTSGANTLEDTHIQIREAKQYNTNLTETNIGDNLDVLAATTEAPIKITDQNTIIQSVKTGKTVDGSKSSVVFNEQYTPLATASGERNSGITLVVPASDAVKAVKYEATLTWTLEDSL